MHRSLLLLAALVPLIFAQSVSLYNSCDGKSDGYYTCNYKPGATAFEYPSSNAQTFVTLRQATDYITLPFDVSIAGKLANRQWGFSNDLSLSNNGTGFYNLFAIGYFATPNSQGGRNFEVLGSAPNRRAIFTWFNYLQENGDYVSGQIKVHENGAIEFATREFVIRKSQYRVLVGFTAQQTGKNYNHYALYNGAAVKGNFSNALWGYYPVAAAPVTTGAKPVTTGAAPVTTGTQYQSPAAAFCARQTFSTEEAYFCTESQAFYRCLKGQNFDRSFQASCDLGLKCRCAAGQDCTYGNTKSPCT